MLVRVVGDLNCADASAFHERCEIAEGAGTVMRRTNDPHTAVRTLDFEQWQLISPAREIMDLINVDVATEEAQSVIDLALAFACGRGPHLRCHDGCASLRGECLREHTLRFAVHRG